MIATRNPCGSPVSRLTPSAAPSRLPVWKAAFPVRMVIAMRPSAAARTLGFVRLSRIASANPRRPASPTRAAMSCRMTVVTTEKRTAQSRVIP